MPQLVFINYKGEELGKHVYEFIFSDTPEIVYGKDWDYPNPSICDDVSPDPTTYSEVKIVKTTYRLKTIQETACYSMEYAMNNIIALAWIDIEGLEDYPENGRMVFHYGDDIEEVKRLLSAYDYVFEEEPETEEK